MKVAVVVFPGSNCDRDTVYALQDLGLTADLVPHTCTSLADYGAVVLPGGFSYGDYLRSGALAARAPIMDAVRTMAEGGQPVLGICNGFQILCEAALLPGALTLNVSRRFQCQWVDLRVTASPPGWALTPGEHLSLPIAHREGAYRLPRPELEELFERGQVVLQYTGPDGSLESCWAPNGSDANIAGVMNRAGNVVGLMPHPERAMEPQMGGIDGRRFLIAWARGEVAVP
jgi:phosphoribosylformylglycinamidine synthase I